MNLTDVDLVWFGQHKVAIEVDPQMRVVALNNHRDQYRVVLGKRAEDMIVERHEANGELFNTFFVNPEFRRMFLDYLAGSYDAVRAADAGDGSPQ